MSIYVVGDIQGCFDSLMKLLDSVGFSKDDKLIAVGDLINRGNHSLEVLEFFMDNSNCDTVLGNHDFWVPIMYHNRQANLGVNYCSLDPIRESRRFADIYDWICSKNLCLKVKDYLVVHGGVLPSWSVDYAFLQNEKICKFLKNKPLMDKFFNNFFVKYECFTWNDSEENELDHYKKIIDAFTRIRYINDDGSICLQRKFSPYTNDVPNAKPWFKIPRADGQKFIFGHWSTLNGRTDDENYIALDTGCVFGKEMTMIELETGSLHKVNCSEKRYGSK